MNAIRRNTKARQKIDRLLEQSGWTVQGRQEMNIVAGQGVAVREFPLKTAFADYLLYADGKAIGVAEAKRRFEGYPELSGCFYLFRGDICEWGTTFIVNRHARLPLAEFLERCTKNVLPDT